MQGPMLCVVYFLGEYTMALIIVESPNKIPKIRKAVGPGYSVMASVGHIMDLSKKKMGIDIPGFKPTYEVNSDKKKVVQALKDEAKKHDVIYIATDDDREGECIAYNLREVLPKRGKTVERVIFKTITKADIQKGLNNPIGFRDDIFDAQQARRMTDRIVGFQVSPLMWTKGLRGTSAGRVQSAALKFVVDREKAIRSFVTEEYWTIVADTKTGFQADFWGVNSKKYVPKTKKQADAIVGDIKGDLTVSGYQKKSRSRAPVAPYMTSTLQKDAGTRFGWTSKRVMDVAQSIFSQGLITYHRTDSTRTEPSKIIDLRDRIDKKYGKKYLSTTINKYGSKAGAQDAHEGIRPTYEPTPMNLTSDDSKLLELVQNRFMASQMASAVFDQVAAKLEYAGKKKYEFRVTGSVQTFDGFLKVYGSSTKDKVLPSMKKGQSIPVKKVTPSQHFTKPPGRYTEPAFTDKMEKEGIGRPATFAATIETLLRRKYVVRDKKALKATEIGIMVSDYLEKHFVSLTSPNFTSDMETELDKISQGKQKLVPVLQKFYDDLMKAIGLASKDKSKDLFKTDKDCPDCKNKHKLIRKIGKFGVFMGCESYPECGYTVIIDEDGNMKETKVETGHACPDCSSKLIERDGKFGKWLGCSGYPVCKWTGKLDAAGNIATKAKAVATKHKCPNCKDGMMTKRSGKFGDFLGCNKYPNCKTVLNLDDKGNIVASKKTSKAKAPAKSTGRKCPKCKKSDLVERNGKFGIFIACSGFPKCKHIEK
jgi:DNA topoisomerase-1